PRSGRGGGEAMGSVRFNDQRDTWMIDYIAANGQRMRQTIGPGEEGRRLARKVLAQREAEAQLMIHRLPASQTMRFGEYADDWLHRTQARVKPNTAESYEDAVERLRPTFGEQRLGAITRHEIDRWLTGPHHGRPRKGQRKKPGPLSATTVNYTLLVLKFILKDAVEHGHLAETPAAKIKPLRRPDHEDGDALHVLQPEEITRLLEVAGEPWHTFYQVTVQSGLRRGEALALRWRDLDLRKGLLHVRRSLNRFREGKGYVVREAPLKSRHSRRTIDLAPSVVEALLAHPAGDDSKQDFVFRSRAGGPIDPDSVDRAFKRHLLLAELPDVRFHDLRHTHASLLIAAGVHPKAIQVRLGHASITTTLNTYGHLMPSAFQGVGERLDALLQGNRKATSPQNARTRVPPEG
ncbi:MAG: tyrosine-type recombinase/integrase, partial [bacterium]|nr:tyrosine-type recombinase/integrase [bacterium]